MVHETRTSDDDLSRRSFLGRGAATGLGIALTGSIGSVFGASPARGDTAADSVPGYGPLVPDPAGLLALPPGVCLQAAGEERKRGEAGQWWSRRRHAERHGILRLLRRGRLVLVVDHQKNACRSTRWCPHLGAA